MFSRLKIRAKIIVSTLIVVFLASAITISFLSYQTFQLETESSIEYAEALAEKNARVVEAKLNEALFVAKTTANMFGGFEVVEIDKRREYYTGVMQSVFAKSSNIKSLWAVFSPNVLDGKDSESIGKPGSSETGKYMPVFYYLNNNIEIQKPEGLDASLNELYVTIPQKTGQDTIVEPYY